MKFCCVNLLLSVGFSYIQWLLGFLWMEASPSSDLMQLDLRTNKTIQIINKSKINKSCISFCGQLKSQIAKDGAMQIFLNP